jgi:hypothetical protein
MIPGALAPRAVLLIMLIVCIANAQDTDKFISTRYGKLTPNDESYLTFNGREILPKVLFDGSSFTQAIATFKLAKSDVVLILQGRGNSCPGNFVFVTVSAKGTKATKNFGTCYDEHNDPVQSGQKIILSMPNLGGKGRSKFVYSNGIVFKNGKQIK